MDLVDYIHAVAGNGRRVHGVLDNGADVVNAVIRRGVDLRYVQNGAVQYAAADLAFIAGVSVNGMQAVHRARKYLGQCGLTGASRARKQVRVGNTVLRHRVLQYGDNAFLLHHFLERPGTPFAVKRHI